MATHSHITARAFSGVVIAVCLGFVAAHTVWVAPASAQVTPIDDEPGIDAPGLGNIVGSPEAGPEPEDAGDRGGWAQLALAGILAGAVLFIGSRILAESRRGRQGNATGADSPSPDAL